MTYLDSQLLYPSAIRLTFSTLKIIKMGWVDWGLPRPKELESIVLPFTSVKKIKLKSLLSE